MSCWRSLKMLVNVCTLLLLVICVDRTPAQPEHPRSSNKQAVSSHSFHRHDVPMEYQYSLVHDYHKPNDEVVKPKQNYKIFEDPHVIPLDHSKIQYAPLPNNAQQGQYDEDYYKSVPKRNHLEPKPNQHIPELSQRYKFHVPGHNVHVYKTSNIGRPNFKTSDLDTESPLRHEVLVYKAATTPPTNILQVQHPGTTLHSAIHHQDVTTPSPIRVHAPILDNVQRLPEWLPHHHYRPNTIPIFNEINDGKRYMNEDHKLIPKLPLLHLNVARGYNFVHDIYNDSPKRPLGTNHMPLYTEARIIPSQEIKTQLSQPTNRITHLIPVPQLPNQNVHS